MDVIRKSAEFRVVDAETGELQTVVEFVHHRRAYVDGRTTALPVRFSYVLHPDGGHCAALGNGAYVSHRTGARLYRVEEAARPPVTWERAVAAGLPPSAPASDVASLPRHS